MKTLYLSQRVPYPPNKGEKLRTFHQIKFLLENGHDIHLCCPYIADDDLTLLQQLSDNYGVHEHHKKLTPAFIRHTSGLLFNKPLSVTNFYSSSLQKIIDHLLANESFDNIICTSSSLAEYIFRCTSLTKLKQRPRLVMDFMDLDSDKWRQYSESSSFPMKWVYRREARLLAEYERKIHDSFDTCFFISQAEVDLFCQHHSCNIPPLAIGNGIETESFTPPPIAPDNKDPVFIFTGVMDYKPNIDAVIWFAENVWPQITQIYPSSRFIIAGMNPVPGVLALANDERIEVTGFVDDILPYYHQSDIFIAPLRIARGVQNKVLQAFSCGLPVIATSMGAEGIEYIDGNNILIADTPDAFLVNIQRLANDKELYNTVSANAQQLIKNNYTWDAKLALLADILK